MSLSTQNPEGFLASLVALGAAVGLGQLLSSGEKITARLLLGRLLTSGALGAAASIPLAWAPDMPRVATYGLACALVTLGVAGVEHLAQRFFGGKGE
jgi:hypothetical protein